MESKNEVGKDIYKKVKKCINHIVLKWKNTCLLLGWKNINAKQD
jgi:hypothetical protein